LVRCRDLWGVKKREELLASLEEFSPRLYRELAPPRSLRLPFRLLDASTNYLSWPLLTDLIPVSFPGVQTKQDQLLVEIDKPKLIKRMEDYFDPKIGNEELARLYPGSMDGTHACEPVATRAYLTKRGFLPQYVVRFLFRPFDLRWIYWEPETKLLGRPSPQYFPHVSEENIWLAAAHHNRKDFDPPQIARRLCCLHIIERSANMFPLLLTLAEGSLFEGDSHQEARHLGNHIANLSDAALRYLDGFSKVADAPHLFHHVSAILHAPTYALENGGALRHDWPRVPLPAKRKMLLSSAELGRKVAALLDPETPVPGVTTGTSRPEMKVIAKPARVGGSGGQLNPGAGDLDVTARWAICGKGVVCMPAKGKSEERDYSEEERQAISDGAAKLGLDAKTAFACLGEKTFDVYLNDVAFWRNVPAKVWDYTLGGYQVIKKWLSYREKDLLGRGLKDDELREATHTARRIAALLLLGPALDANYEAAKADPYPWPGTAAGSDA
jgi:Type ISP C-terminal specificity domain